MTILVCTANTTPADGPGLYGTQDSHVSAGITDTYLNDAATTTNYGNSTAWNIVDDFGEERRAIIKFDISSITANSTITSAHLMAYQTGDGSVDAVSCYGLLRDWVEGDGTGGSGATWATYDGSNNWGTAGALNTSSDVDSAAQDTDSTAGNGTWRRWDVSSWVQAVVNGSRTNYGLLVGFADRDDASGYVDMRSSGGTDGQRPELWVEYTAPTGPTFGSGITVSGIKGSTANIQATVS